MDSSVESKARRPCTDEDGCHRLLPCNAHPHHYHHYHVSPHCPLHSYMLHSNNHSPICPLFNLHPLSQNPPPDPRNLWPSDSKEAVPDTLLMHEENMELEQEEEEDPVFVLTDEWREFFAKSEAKRRLEKKQTKKKGKK